MNGILNCGKRGLSPISIKFRQATVVGGTVTWPGDLDLAPDAMHEEIKRRVGSG